MRIYTIYPILGVKNDVPPDDMAMYKPIGENAAFTHCVDGRNFDTIRKRNACNKTTGKAQWSNSATATTQSCLGLFELSASGNKTVWSFMTDGTSNGRVFRYDSSRDPVRISDVAGHSGAVEFKASTLYPYSIIRFGDHMVFTDFGEHTPYCADFNDTVLTKLISSGTEYKFRYLESFQNYILGAYSDQSNGELELRWSGVLPVPGTSCVFASGDALYVPTDDPITGAKRLGRSNCFVYCEQAINRLDYYGNWNTPFGFSTPITGIGTTNHDSIVNAGNLQYFYSADWGFCSFDGRTVTPIADGINEWASGVAYSYYTMIVGTHWPEKGEIAWAVPLEASSTANAILFYNYRTGQWRRKDINCAYIRPMTWAESVTWQDLIDLGYTTWQDFGNLRWIDLLNESREMFLSGSDGHLYYDGTEYDNGSDWDAYREEPIISFGAEDKSLILELWFNIVETGDYSIYVYYRGGDTVGECRSANWEALDEVSFNSPANAVCHLAKTNRYHQIKWGSDGGNEPFSVHSIQFKYEPEGRY